MKISNFRKHPALELKRVPFVGTVLSAVFRVVDRRGLLSDLAADPQRLWEGWWPYTAARRRWLRLPHPTVSVIVATKDNEDTIERSLRSIQQQTFENLEIIVVNDCSADATGEVVKRLQSNDPRIRYFENSTHLGTGRSRNRGLAAASGHYVTFQDGDDFSLPARIEKQFEVFDRFPGKKLSFCNYVRVSAAGRRLTINDFRVRKCIISMMFPREEVLSKVGFFSDASISEDSDYYERIKIAFGAACQVTVFQTLYEALFRPTSSFFSDVKINYESHQAVRYERDNAALDRLSELRARHKLMASGQLSVFVPYK
jgi:glycosyltransferase involved in cell wall biosynthesis